MNKILILITIISILWSCEEIPNETVEPKSADYLVTEINAPDIIVFTESDNSITTSIVVNQSETLEAVWFNISTLNGLESLSSSNFMSSNDNITFSGKAKLDANLLSGKYEISYYIQDNVSSSDNNVKKVGTKQFQYLSEVQNFPPSINDLKMPSEINKNVRFSFNIKVSDPNGLNDIQSVYYEVKDPDGNKISNSQGISKFPLFDDGNTTENSDVTANDGIYSVYLIFPVGSQSGNWVFNFNAVDKSDSISNTIIHTLKVN
jgi:hypothetical protein